VTPLLVSKQVPNALVVGHEVPTVPCSDVQADCSADTWDGDRPLYPEQVCVPAIVLLQEKDDGVLLLPPAAPAGKDKPKTARRASPRE
jgi:hypothetical protein